ncbi:MAG: hypothetical protein PHT69_15735 [Bacteroidales bacterium]|nr:hypothetical protein [Bacteroidales bacterium]
MNKKEFYINIAGFKIHLFSADKNHFLSVPVGFEPFLTGNDEDVMLHIRVEAELPFVLTDAVEVFRARDPELKPEQSYSDFLWAVYQYRNENFVVTAEPQRNIFPYLYAYFPKNEEEWTIFCSGNYYNEGSLVLNPLAYPMGPLLMYHLALYNDAIMIHASGIEFNKKGLVFSGFSGIGKSTMAGLWHTNGYKVINDDRLMLRMIDGQCHVFNTPMPYADQPKETILKHAFLLKQHPTNYLVKLDGVHKLTRILAFCIQHHYDKEHIRIIMDTISRIASCITVHELGFVPDNSVIELIKNEFTND